MGSTVGPVDTEQQSRGSVGLDFRLFPLGTTMTIYRVSARGDEKPGD